MQFRVSAPFKRFTTISVIENGSRLPKTDAAFRWRQRFSSRRSIVGYSTSLTRYPLPKKLAKAPVRKCGPPCRHTIVASGPAPSRNVARVVASWVVLALNRLNTATQTRRNVELSHVRTITQISELLSANSMLYCQCAFIQPNAPERLRGYIRFNIIA